MKELCAVSLCLVSLLTHHIFSTIQLSFRLFELEPETKNIFGFSKHEGAFRCERDSWDILVVFVRYNDPSSGTSVDQTQPFNRSPHPLMAYTIQNPNWVIPPPRFMRTCLSLYVVGFSLQC